MKVPFLSIIIASYNYGSMIEESIKSVLSQSDDDYELIVVDGGSTDNTLDVLKKYDSKIAWWVSEKDSGQSEAFNKGFAKARGEVLTWLNADDLMLPGTIAAVKKAFRRDKNVDWVGGNMVCFESGTYKVNRVFFGPVFYPRIIQGVSSRIPVFGPSTFWKRSIYHKVGPINEKYHYTMDSEYWARLTKAGVTLHRISHYCWGFRIHSDSKTASEFEGMRPKETQRKVDAETRMTRQNVGYHPTRAREYVYTLMRLLDGSYIRAMINKRRFLGRTVTECFGK